MADPQAASRATCRVLAVTGTDTEIGKTVITRALAARARILGLRVAAMKPIESGISSRFTPRGSAAISDAQQLADAAGGKDAIDVVGPITLEEPLAPMMAANRAGVTIDLSILDRARNTLSSGRDLLLVEGAGGILAPITREYSFAHLFKRWDSDVLVVAGNRLGVLNHTLLTVRVAESEGLRVRAVILTDISEKDPTIAEATNYDALVSLLPHLPIYRFPWIDRIDDSSALAAAASGAGLDRILLPDATASHHLAPDA
ncbi:MAG: dethiobiotin synthase [Phycisphaerae bacterium]|nr:dethiobiotin synthase [Gemmatimonadaceae bacterium]